MKDLNIFPLIFLIFLALAGSCQSDDISQNCEGPDGPFVETFYSEEFESIPCGLQNIENDSNEINLVITNQSDLEKYFTCYGQLPEIDFEKYFILAGRYQHSNCAIFDSQSVSICNDRIVYKVNILEQVCQAVTSVFYATVIEKKYSNLPVDFNVQFKN